MRYAPAAHTDGIHRDPAARPIADFAFDPAVQGPTRGGAACAGTLHLDVHGVLACPDEHDLAPVRGDECLQRPVDDISGHQFQYLIDVRFDLPFGRPAGRDEYGLPYLNSVDIPSGPSQPGPQRSALGDCPHDRATGCHQLAQTPGCADQSSARGQAVGQHPAHRCRIVGHGLSVHRGQSHDLLPCLSRSADRRGSWSRTPLSRPGRSYSRMPGPATSRSRTPCAAPRWSRCTAARTRSTPARRRSPAG